MQMARVKLMITIAESDIFPLGAGGTSAISHAYTGAVPLSAYR
jgi:hypothetical protein